MGELQLSPSLHEGQPEYGEAHVVGRVRTRFEQDSVVRDGGLAPGERLVTEFGHEVRIVRFVGGGGQGQVYEIEYDGRRMALKWYHTNWFIDKDAFKSNLLNNIYKGAPTRSFVWPLDITKEVDGKFGYVMELIDTEQYIEASEFFLRPGLFPSFKRASDACMYITQAFRILHNAGYGYQDINGGNFFINPTTGATLIADNDNVAPTGVRTGIVGTPRFMAPEIVRKEALPDMRSDLHSLAVLIFFLMLFQHPLMGKRSSGALDNNSNERLFGTDPVFIFDEHNHSNAALQVPGNSALQIWSALPPHMQELFRTAFSHDALMHPSHRVRENRWVKELARLRTETIQCRCGNELFLDGSAPKRCEACGAYVVPRLRMELPGYNLPLVDDSRIYTCQLGVVTNQERALEGQMWAHANKSDPSTIGLSNISQETWRVSTGGTIREVPPGKIILAHNGMTLHIKSIDIPIRVNR